MPSSVPLALPRLRAQIAGHIPAPDAPPVRFGRSPCRHAVAPRASKFGVGRRESHVADSFYSRFETPELTPTSM